LEFSNCLVKKGEIVMYEGKKAEVIGVTPLLTIKLENRVLCGALHNQIEPIKESDICRHTP